LDFATELKININVDTAVEAEKKGNQLNLLINQLVEVDHLKGRIALTLYVAGSGLLEDFARGLCEQPCLEFIYSKLKLVQKE
jgi:hypothetical protein